MAGQRCQVCGGKVVNGRCSLCGMPYRNDEVLYHLNEPREIHYKHASAKVRDMMRQYGQDADQTTQHNGNVNRNTNANRNTNPSRNTDLNRNLTGIQVQQPDVRLQRQLIPGIKQRWAEIVQKF